MNRDEPVDLVVSVYDQSLLGIAADKSIDIRNFYLADESASATMSRATSRRTVGDVTIAQLLKQAREILEKNKDQQASPDNQYLRQLVQQLTAGTQTSRTGSPPIMSTPCCSSPGSRWMRGPVFINTARTGIPRSAPRT